MELSLKVDMLCYILIDIIDEVLLKKVDFPSWFQMCYDGARDHSLDHPDTITTKLHYIENEKCFSSIKEVVLSFNKRSCSLSMNVVSLYSIDIYFTPYFSTCTKKVCQVLHKKKYYISVVLYDTYIALDITN